MIKRSVMLIWFWSYIGHAELQEYQIVSLAPHTTEWIYELNAQHLLVGVSEYSNYPVDAKRLPVVANHLGVDFEKVIALKPDLILAWRGGNQPQDIDRLKTLGFDIFESNPSTLADIPVELTTLGKIIGKQDVALKRARAFSNRLDKIKKEYKREKTTRVFYYLWSTPLMSIGRNAWATHLLHECGAENIFSDSPIAYPEVQLESVIARQPSLVISATGSSIETERRYWTPWLSALDIDHLAIRTINPDLVHRFTSRVLDGLTQLCDAITHE